MDKKVSNSKPVTPFGKPMKRQKTDKELLLPDNTTLGKSFEVQGLKFGIPVAPRDLEEIKIDANG